MRLPGWEGVRHYDNYGREEEEEVMEVEAHSRGALPGESLTQPDVSDQRRDDWSGAWRRCAVGDHGEEAPGEPENRPTEEEAGPVAPSGAWLAGGAEL